MGTIRLFRHYIPASFIVLASLENAIFILSLLLSLIFVTHRQCDSIYLYIVSLAFEVFVFSISMFLSFIAVGLYRRHLSSNPFEVFFRTCMGLALGGLFINQLSHTVPDLDLDSRTWFVMMVMVLVGILVSRLVLLKILKSTALKRRILLFGWNEKSHELLRDLESSGNKTYEFIPFPPFTDVQHKETLFSDQQINLKLLKIVEEKQIDEIVIAFETKRYKLPAKALLHCKSVGVTVLDLVSFYEREVSKIKIDALSTKWFVRADSFIGSDWLKSSKRVMDIVLSCVFALVALPFMIVAAFAIWVEAGFKGPILYRQSRVGKGGVVFNVLKFRSMQLNAEQNGPQWTSLGDERVTRIGRFLRKCHMDELPQILNVMKGEMSFVGPRPERPEFVSELKESIPFYDERHSVKPGITGWAQICYSYGSSTEDSYQKLQYDLYYVKNYSLFLDLIILFQTFEVVVFGRGSR